jgi:hypothetical protein
MKKIFLAAQYIKENDMRNFILSILAALFTNYYLFGLIISRIGKVLPLIPKIAVVLKFQLIPNYLAWELFRVICFLIVVSIYFIISSKQNYIDWLIHKIKLYEAKRRFNRSIEASFYGVDIIAFEIKEIYNQLPHFFIKDAIIKEYAIAYKNHTNEVLTKKTIKKILSKNFQPIIIYEPLNGRALGFIDNTIFYDYNREIKYLIRDTFLFNPDSGSIIGGIYKACTYTYFITPIYNGDNINPLEYVKKKLSKNYNVEFNSLDISVLMQEYPCMLNMKFIGLNNEIYEIKHNVALKKNEAILITL